MTRKVGTVGRIQVRWNPETREYIARIPGNLEADYFTSDRVDAFATARDMDRRIKEG